MQWLPRPGKFVNKTNGTPSSCRADDLTRERKATTAYTSQRTSIIVRLTLYIRNRMALAVSFATTNPPRSTIWFMLFFPDDIILYLLL